MYYRDIIEAKNQVLTVSDWFECSDELAEAIIAECATRHALGNEGKAFAPQCTSGNEYRLLHTEIPEWLEHFGGVDVSDLAYLLFDAWKEGITRKDRVTVHLDTDTDGTCGECGNSVAAHEDECDACGSTDICRMVMVTVNDTFADMWADHDQSIDGSSWEGDGSDFAYTSLMDHPDLVSQLRKEGYKLDLSAYDGEIAEDDAA